MTAANDNTLAPLHVFRFQVDFYEPGSEDAHLLCSGAFSELSGLEATMEPRVIPEGGRNYGPLQRVGPVSFATVVLKRGMTSTRDLWTWFELINGGAYAHRLDAVVTQFDNAGHGVLAWKLKRAMPIKFKTADLNANATDVGVEELHLAHEGLLPAEVTASLFQQSSAGAGGTP